MLIILISFIIKIILQVFRKSLWKSSLYIYKWSHYIIWFAGVFLFYNLKTIFLMEWHKNLLPRSKVFWFSKDSFILIEMKEINAVVLKV